MIRNICKDELFLARKAASFHDHVQMMEDYL